VRLLRPSILTLTLALAGVPGVVVPQVASAAEVFADGPLVAVLPSSSVVAASTSELRVLALDEQGAPIDGLSLSAEASAGSLGELKALGDGLYVLPFTAPADAGEVTVTLRGKTPSKASVKVDHRVVVRGAGRITGSVTPERAVLGRDTAVTLKAQAGSRGVWARSSAGEVGTTVRRGDTYTAQLTLPKVNFPQVAIVTWADAGEPRARFGALPVPLSGAVAFPVKGPAGATVLLEVDGREFGPVQLDDDGKGKVPIEVPPGIQQATKIVVDGDETTESTLDLNIPGTKRLALVPVGEAVPADPLLAVPVRVAVVTPTGEPDEAAKVALKASNGSLGPVRHVGGGIYEASWELPTQTGEVTLTASLPDSEVDVDTLVVAAVDGLPGRVSLVSKPESLTEGAGSVILSGDVNGRIVIEGATAASPRVDGTTVVVDVSDVAPGFRAVGVPKMATSDQAVASVVVLPDASRLDPTKTTGVLVAAVDAWGLPVPETKVSLVIEGGATGPSAVTTGPDGVGRFTLGGPKAGLVAVHATAGEAEGHAAVVVAPPSAKVPSLKPTTGVAARWAATHPVLGGSGEAVASPVAVPLRRFLLVETDGDAQAGATVSVRSQVVDAQGKLVDEVPSLSASAGEVSEPSDADADGFVSWSVVLPDDFDGELVLTVADPTGAEEVVRLGEPAAAPAPVRKPPAPAGDHPWLRASAAGVVSSYRYEQTPSDDPGGLLPATMSVGGEAGTAASPAGIELDARAWFDEADLEWLGVHGRVRTTWYAIEADLFQTPATDQLIDVELDLLARYPVELDSDRFWAGARVGFRYDDFVLFEGCLEPDCALSYTAVGVPGLGLGPEVGAELGRLFVVGGYSFGLANFSQPFSHSVDLDLGVHVVDSVFVDLGFTSASRRVQLRGVDSGIVRGEVRDSQMIGRLGVGFAL
jgi:hypothetical protein